MVDTEPTASANELDAGKSRLDQSVAEQSNDELRRLRERAESAERLLEAARSELAACQEDAQRYASGLEEAVGELNKLGRARRSAQPTRQRRQAVGSTWFSFVSGPRLRQFDREATSYGRIYNAGTAAGTVDIDVQLYYNGELIEEDSTSLYLQAGETVPFEYTWYDVPTGGSLRGTATIVSR